MDYRTLVRDAKVVKILNYASAATDRTSGVIDTAGYGKFDVIVSFSAITTNAVTNIYLAHSDAVDDANTLNTGANVATTSQTVADDDDGQVFIIGNVIPTKRYYQLTVNKDGTNATAEEAIVILSSPKEMPVTHGTGTGTGEGHAAVNYESVGTAASGTI